MVNPVDITRTPGNSRGDILPISARDPGADAFLISVPVAGRGYDVDAFASDAAEFAALTGKPIVIAAPPSKVATRFRAHGLPVFDTESQGVAALNQLMAHQELMEQARNARSAASAQETANPVPRKSQDTDLGVLDEAQALKLAAEAGVPVVRHRLCSSKAEAIAAMGELGAPVAVKGCSSESTHKSEAEMVHLNVVDEPALRRAWRELQDNAKAQAVALSGVIVAEMARGQREMIVGAHVDPTFGAHGWSLIRIWPSAASTSTRSSCGRRAKGALPPMR